MIVFILKKGNIMFTDTHCHLFTEYYDDKIKIIKNAKKNKITKCINNGCDFNTNKEVLEFSQKNINVYSAIGFQPQSLEEYEDNQLNQIIKNIDKIVAIGEIGLDFYYEPYDKDEQISIFEKQLEIAQKYNKPVIIHSRKATDDTIRILKKYPKVKGVIHSFNGSIETAREYLKLGFLLGLNGVITFKNSNSYKMIEELPLNSFVLETDSPYLTPEPYRGTKNEPKNILDIAKKVAAIKSVSLDEVSRITEQNVHNTFDI